MKIFIDMDGVIAVSQPVENYSQKGIFKRLPPISGSHYFLATLRNIAHVKGAKLVALTKTFNGGKHEEDKVDKIFWIKFYFPEIFDDVIVLDPSENKGMYVEQPEDILVDDYGKNCLDWVRSGGIAIQQFEHKDKKNYLTSDSYAMTINLINQIFQLGE